MSDDAAPDPVPEETTSPPEPELSWAGHTATVQQAMEWGIDLCGQLAHVHDEDEVVGNISPATIRRTRFGQPRLPDPDPRADHPAWVDVAALAEALQSLVPDPSPEFRYALLPPYASAVALGEELQDAQRAMGLPVSPIPFEGPPPVPLGGRPIEVPPEPAEEEETSPEMSPEMSEGPSALDLPPGPPRPELEPRPNPWVLLAVAVVVVAVAVAVGIGWR